MRTASFARLLFPLLLPSALIALVGIAGCDDASSGSHQDIGVSAGDASARVDGKGAVDLVMPDATVKPDATMLSCVASAPVLPPLKIVPVITMPAGQATYARQPPGSTDWYVVEQRGRIRIIRNGKLLATPFIDIAPAFGGNYGERGLLSMAFHPDYAQNGRFFLMGTPSDGADGSFAAVDQDAVSEWKRSANPDVAVATKVRDIVVLAPSAQNHNGGTIQFGADHFLYVGTGDGGGGCNSDQPGAPQDTTKLFGKILRLDIDGSPPFAAAGNPFAADLRVFLYGLRNPFRWNFDSATGDLFISDVGQNQYEEIDVAPAGVAGLNFGWPRFEGAAQGTCGDLPLGGPSPYTPPIVSIDRQSSSPFADYSSIIAAPVYRGAAMPALQGVLFFADFQGAKMGAIRYCNGQTYGPVALPLSDIPTGTGGGVLQQISAFVEGNDGEIYVIYGMYGDGTRIGKLALQ